MTTRQGSALTVRFAAACLTVVLAATTLVACSRASEGDPSASASAAVSALEVNPDSPLGMPKLIGLEPVIRPETMVLESADSPVDGVEILNPDACTPGDVDRVPCDYRLTFARAPAGLEQGSVLVSDVTDVLPYGLLVKVTSVDAGAVLATEATFGDAVEQGEFLMEQEFTAADVVSIRLEPGVTATGDTALLTRDAGGMGNSVPQPAAGLSQTVLDQAALDRARTVGVGGGRAFNFDIGHKEIVDGVYADGSVGFDMGCGAYGGLTWEEYWGVPIYPNGAYFEAKCGVTQDGSITVTAEAKQSLEDQKKIAELELGTITFFVGPVPVVLVPEVEVWVNASGEVTANMSFGATEHIGVVAGVKYHGGIHLIKDFSSDFSASSSLGSGRLSAHAGVEIRASLLVYGLAGPQIVAELYVDLEGKPMGERPIWCMTGGVKASVGLKIDLGIQDLRWGPEEIFDEDTELACAGNSAPTIAWSTSATSHVVYPASTYNPPALAAIAQDAEEGKLPVTWTSSIDGNLGTTANGSLSLTGLSLGEHIITATTTDSDGATASISVPVSARKASASVEIQVKDGSGNFVSASQASGLKGGFVTVRIVGTSPIGIQVGSCLASSWSGPLAVTDLGGCEYQVSLSTAGTHTMSVSSTDPDGNKGTDSISIVVTNPAAGSPPSFTEIAGKKTSVSPAVNLCDGCALGWGETATLDVKYVNHAQAGKTVRYEWDMQTKQSGFAAGSWTVMSGSDSTPNAGSSRTFTAPTQYSKGYTYTFRVKVYDQATNALLFSDTYTLTYQGPPA